MMISGQGGHDGVRTAKIQWYLCRHELCICWDGIIFSLDYIHETSPLNCCIVVALILEGQVDVSGHSHRDTDPD